MDRAYFLRFLNIEFDDLFFELITHFYRNMRISELVSGRTDDQVCDEAIYSISILEQVLSRPTPVSKIGVFKYDSCYREDDIEKIYAFSEEVGKWGRCSSEEKDAYFRWKNLVLDDEKRTEILKYSPSEDKPVYYDLIFTLICFYFSFSLTKEYERTVELFEERINDVQLRCLFANVLDYLNIPTNSEEKDSFEEALQQSSYEFIEMVCYDYLSADMPSFEKRKYIYFSVLLYAFVLVVLDPDLERETAIEKAASRFSILFSETFLLRHDCDNAILFSANALSCDDEKDRFEAFNLLGLSAIDSKQYQLAYDAFFSWINSKMVFQSDEIRLKNGRIVKLESTNMVVPMLQSESEQLWRKENKEDVAIMYGNFAYVCGEIHDILRPSVQKEELLCLAKYFVQLAITLDSHTSEYLCSAGSLFKSSKEYRKAQKYYERYLEEATSLPDRVSALRLILSVYSMKSEKQSNRGFDEVSGNFEMMYQELMAEENNCSEDESLEKELISGRDLFLLIHNCNRLSTGKTELKYKLFRIDSVVKEMLHFLKRDAYTAPCFVLHCELLDSEEYNCIFPRKIEKMEKGIEKDAGGMTEPQSIAYYTKLSNLKYLFETVKTKTGGEMNCLTMMHARYMNDPDEGLVMFENLDTVLPMTPEELRDVLYDQKYVFLKSFTGLIDQLNMWTMYGSDREDGKDCNGCCICLAPESFLIDRDLQDRPDSVFAAQREDDYCLYNVAYIDGKRITVNGVRSLYMENRFERLRVLLDSVKSSLSSSRELEKDTKIVSACLVRILEKLMFLFKDMSYHMEAESRLIISRDVVDSLDIEFTKQLPPKLYINAPFQVYPEKIYLGPKVENTDEWIPHIQFELSKIRAKWNFGEMREYMPTVRTSKINIR